MRSRSASGTPMPSSLMCMITSSLVRSPVIGDAPAAGRILDRVLQQIDQHLLHARVVGQHRRQIVGQRDRRTDGRGLSGSIFCTARRTRRAHVHRLAASVPARPAGCARRPAGSPPSCSAGRSPRRRLSSLLAHCARRHRVRAVGQQFGIAADDRERRLQFVRDDREERGLQLLGLAPRRSRRAGVTSAPRRPPSPATGRTWASL